MLCRCIQAGASEALTGADQSQLLGVLRLATRFQARAAADAAAQLLALIPAQLLDWHTVTAALELPDVTDSAERPSLGGQALLAAARERLQADLGDLDATMCDADKRGRLMALSPAALCTLLADPRTRASCELAVLAAASAWLSEGSTLGAAAASGPPDW